MYLADSAKACMVEVERAANAASTTAIKMLEAAYRLHHIQVEELNVLDLRTPETSSVSTTTTSTVTTGPPAKQSDTPPGSCTCKGSWSAPPGASLVISAYEQRTRPGQLHLTHSENLTPALYTQYRSN